MRKLDPRGFPHRLGVELACRSAADESRPNGLAQARLSSRSRSSVSRITPAYRSTSFRLVGREGVEEEHPPHDVLGREPRPARPQVAGQRRQIGEVAGDPSRADAAGLQGVHEPVAEGAARASGQQQLVAEVDAAGGRAIQVGEASSLAKASPQVLARPLAHGGLLRQVLQGLMRQGHEDRGRDELEATADAGERPPFRRRRQQPARMAELHGPIVQVVAVGQQGPSLAAGDELRRLEAAKGHVAIAPDRPPAESGAVGVRDVLDQRQAVLVAQGPQLVQAQRFAEHVRHDDGPHRAVQQAAHRFRVDVAGVGQDIGQGDARSALHGRQHGGPVPDRRRDHRVARADAQRLQGRETGRRAVDATQRTADAEERGHVPLERLERLRMPGRGSGLQEPGHPFESPAADPGPLEERGFVLKAHGRQTSLPSCLLRAAFLSISCHN